MHKRSMPIDSEALKKLEQEIYHNVINSSNKNEVLLKLRELKNLTIDGLREVMPWGLIKKEIGIKQIVFSWITDGFVKIKRKIARNKSVAISDNFEFSKINPEKAYNLTYKYYLKSIFDNINNDIKDTLNKYEKNYVFVYPHEDAFEESGQEINIYSSKETKKLETNEKILSLFRIATWILPIVGFIKLIDINVDWWINIIIWVVAYFSLNALYNICIYYIKILRQISVYKDKMVFELKKIIDSELQPETAASYILDKFYEKVVEKIREKESINHNVYRIAAITLTIVLAIVFVYPSFIEYKVPDTVDPSPTIPAIPSVKPSISKEEVEKYLKAKGATPLISEEPLPEAEIRFVKEEITGKLSSVTMNLSLDCTSITVITDDENGIFKIKATINSEIKAKGWEIINGKILVLNENKTLKKSYKDGLYDEILSIYQSKESVIQISNEIEKRAKALAEAKINDLIRNGFPDIDKIEDIDINYQKTNLDMSDTDLKL